MGRLYRAVGLEIDHDDILSFCTSRVLSASSLLAYRSVAFGYNFAVLSSNLIIIWDEFEWTFFTFFTNLSFILMTFYFGAAAWVTVRHVSNGTQPHSSTVRTLRVWLVLIRTNALFLDIVFWAFLYEPIAKGLNHIDYYYNTHVHLMNFFWTTAELIFSQHRVSWRHVFIPFVFVVLYACFAWTYHAIRSIWIYPILDFADPHAAAYYVGCAFLNVICFFAMYGLYRFKERLVRPKKDEPDRQRLIHPANGSSQPMFY